MILIHAHDPHYEQLLQFEYYLFDENGRRYLDAFGGIATVSCGHCHPDVVEAVVNQTKLLQHTTVLYLNHAVVDFAEALASKLPGELKVNSVH